MNSVAGTDNFEIGPEGSPVAPWHQIIRAKAVGFVTPRGKSRGHRFPAPFTSKDGRDKNSAPAALLPANKLGRIVELDGLRGIAVTMVLLWHYVRCQVVGPPHSLVIYLKQALCLSWSGVDLFFVLSGFLITGILLDNRSAPRYFQTFYARRACRIFPLYFLCLALFAFAFVGGLASQPSMQWLFDRAIPLWTYATFTQNIFMGLRGNFGPHWMSITWSVAAEEQFYLLMPLLIYVTSRRVLIWILCAGVIAAPILRFMIPGFHALVNVPWRADALLSGGVLAILVRTSFFLPMVKRHKGVLLSLFGVFLLGFALMTCMPDSLGAFGYLWLAGLCSTFILVAIADVHPLIGKVLRNPILTRVGILSYGIYMFHEAVSGITHGLLRGAEPSISTVSDALVTLLAFAITIVLAVLSFRFLEAPILKYGHSFQYSPKVSKRKQSSKSFPPSGLAHVNSPTPAFGEQVVAQPCLDTTA